MEDAASQQSANSKTASTRQSCRLPHLAAIDQLGGFYSEHAIRMSRTREKTKRKTHMP